MSRNWYAINRKPTGVGSISIHDDIGSFGVRARNFVRDLKALGDVKRIDLSINSPGGEVFDGFHIYNALKRHPAKIFVTVDGLAASMASVIAMAGNTITMPENAMIMIHNPTGYTAGGDEQISSFADALKKMKESIISAYVTRTRQSRAAIIEMMDRETWLSAREAVAKGFADVVEAPVQAAAKFDLSRFKRAPGAKGKAASGINAAKIYENWNAAGKRHAPTAPVREEPIDAWLEGGPKINTAAIYSRWNSASRNKRKSV